MKLYPQMVNGRLVVPAVLFVAFVATVVLANWLVNEAGIVHVGLGYQAPAGVFVVGVAFSLRDALQERAGKIAVIAAIGLGAALSFGLEDLRAIALASAAAFAVSETLDFAIYTLLRRRSWLAAATASNAIGLIVDSVIFLTLAFGSLEFLEGQIFAKAYMTALAIFVTGMGRRALLSRNPHTELA